MISGTSKYTFDQRKMLLMMQDAIDRGVELTMKEWVKQM